MLVFLPALIESDTDRWYESGAVRNVMIRDNLFEDCYTSGNNILDEPWGWGEAVISITPSIRPKNDSFEPFHRNITIENNEFKHYDSAILYARSVRNLGFKNNRLSVTHTFKPFYRKVNFYLDGCKEVNISKNYFGAHFPSKNIVMKNMKRKDIKVSDNNSKLKISHE